MATPSQPSTARYEVSSTASAWPYVADFYCIDAKLVIELDGTPHHTPEGKQRDEVRNAWMRSQGIEVLRFGGWEAERDAQRVLEVIDSVLQRRCPNPQPR